MWELTKPVHQIKVCIYSHFYFYFAVSSQSCHSLLRPKKGPIPRPSWNELHFDAKISCVGFRCCTPISHHNQESFLTAKHNAPVELPSVKAKPTIQSAKHASKTKLIQPMSVINEKQKRKPELTRRSLFARVPYSVGRSGINARKSKTRTPKTAWGEDLLSKEI